MKRLVLLGGGHSHLEVVRTFGLRPPAHTEITLVDPAQFATYSGMLPGLIAGHYSFHDCHVDLKRLARSAAIGFVQSRACRLDTAQRRVVCDNGVHLDYDVLSIDVGSTPAAAQIPGAAEYAIGVKPFSVFAQRWDQLIAAALAGSIRNIVVVGGGAGGLELVLAMHHRLAQAALSHSIGFTVVTAAACLVPDHNARTRTALQGWLDARSIVVHLNARVETVESTGVILSGGLAIASDATMWATAAAAPAWFAGTGLALDARGFISTGESLASLSHPEIFAAGDCGTIKGFSYPKSGVYAVREGPVLAGNLAGTLDGKPIRNYRPQRLALALISRGDRYAIASYGRLALEGSWVWRWKDYIDRKFVRRYSEVSVREINAT